MTTHVCATPIDYERFLAYWFGELDAAEEERVELQLVTCPHCGERAEAWALETQGIGDATALLPKGLLQPAEVEALGARATIVDVDGSGRLELTLRRDNVHVFRVALDPELSAGCERIDVVYTMAGVQDPLFYVANVPHRDAEPLHLACSGHVLASHGGDLTMRVVGTREDAEVTLLESNIHFV